MNEMTNSADYKFMSLAIDEAKKSLETGNFPCGAVLVVNGEILGRSRNEKESHNDRISHAEMLLYIKHSSDLKRIKKQRGTITMYTTLEPCLMCFGSAVMHRVEKIYIALPDPLGDMSKFNGKILGTFYDNLPNLEYGLCLDESYSLIKEYLVRSDTDEARDYVQLFEDSIVNFKSLLLK